MLAGLLSAVVLACSLPIEIADGCTICLPYPKKSVADYLLEADAVVLVTARTPVDGLYRAICGQLESMDPGSVPTLRKIGDCDAPAIIAAAVYAGHRYARELETDVAETLDVRHDKLFDPD